MDIDEDVASGNQLPFSFVELKALLMSIVQTTKDAHDGTRSRAELFFVSAQPPRAHCLSIDVYELTLLLFAGPAFPGALP